MTVVGKRLHKKGSSKTHSVLTGDSRIDLALRRLSSILAEIAEHDIHRKNGDAIENQIQHKINNGHVTLPSEDVSNV